MLVITGKATAGKTAVVNALKEEGYKTVTTYTTRPRRPGESPDTYHFIPEPDFLQKAQDGFFAEWYGYKTAGGTWYYGSAKEDYLGDEGNKIIILNPEGLKQVRQSGIPVESVYLCVEDDEIIRRFKDRGDDPEEAKRRFFADKEDFKDIESLVDITVYSGAGSPLSYVVREIREFIGGKENVEEKEQSKI